MNDLRAWAHRNLTGDPVIWIIVFGLSFVSVLTVYSATGTLAYQRDRMVEQYLINHTLLLLFSLFCMWLAHRIDFRYYSRLSRIALLVSVPLLLYAFFFGAEINEARRWIEIPLINKTFQPSDLAKLALITNLAAMLSKRQKNIKDMELLLPVLIWIGVICGLIALSDFSSSALLFATCGLLMLIGRVPVKYLVILSMVGLLSGSVAMMFGSRWETLKGRIERFADGSGEVSFQAQQGYIAISTGGIAGKGPGNSDQKNFLPLSFSDYIYAIIIEEYGLFGGAIVLFLYLALLYRGVRAVANVYRGENIKSDKVQDFGSLLSAGLSFAIVLQAFANMGVVVGLLPETGLPLPMISMGGTSLLFTGFALGIILSVSRGETQVKARAKRDVKANLVKA
jgi:cell division protein FtsW